MLGLKASAGQDLLGGLLLGFVVVGIPDQPVAHTVEHVDDVAEGLVHLAHGVVGGGLSHPTPAGTGDVCARRPHLAGLVLHRLGVGVKPARHRPHLVRISQKTRRHISISLLVDILKLRSLWPKGTNAPCSRHVSCGACPLVGRYTMAGVYPGGACPFVGNPAGTGYAAAGTDSGSGAYPAAGERATTESRREYLEATAPPTPAAAATPAARGS